MLVILYAKKIIKGDEYIFQGTVTKLEINAEGNVRKLTGSNWSGFYALIFYNPEVQEYIKNVFSVILNEWGYDMVKLDFLYAVCLLPRKNKTRGQNKGIEKVEC